MDRMSKEEFHRKWDDTHTEIQAISALAGNRSNGSLIKHHPEDKNITTRKILGKNLIEAEGRKKRTDQLQELILDSVNVRHKEILDKDSVPFIELLKVAVRLIPQESDNKIEHTFTFADMVKRASIEVVQPVTIDIVAADG